MKKSYTAFVALILVGGMSAQSVTATSPPEPATAALSAETRALLIREMQALGESMARIHKATVVGDHETIAAEAHKIHDSFVLAQALDAARRHELHSNLPQRFLVLDQRLHSMAAELAAAARQRSADVERFWFAEMTRACVDCHTEFAGARFPGLTPVENAVRDRH